MGRSVLAGPSYDFHRTVVGLVVQSAAFMYVTVIYVVVLLSAFSWLAVTILQMYSDDSLLSYAGLYVAAVS